MIFEQHKKDESNLQSNTPNTPCPDETSKITTIAELRQRARARNRARYKDHEIKLAQERMEFAIVMHDLCNRLAIVFNIDNAVTVEAIYGLFEAYSWFADGVFHSVVKPLSIRFLVPLSFGGQLTINNIVPCYTGLDAGAFVIRRDRPRFRPEPGVPVLLEAIS